MKIYLIYGGKSAEHDISILTAHSIIKAIYFNYYEVVPVYITKAGAWIQGQSLSEPVAFSENLYLEPGSERRFADSQDGKSYGELISPADIQSEDAVIFPVLHGPNGEDGTVQGLFEVLNMPYVGCGVLASASGMDKIVSKHLFQQAGLPQVPYVAVTRNDWKNDREKIFIQCEGSLIYPMYIKPANMGSSVGISKATNLEELTAAIETAFRYDRRVVVEQGIEAREIEIGYWEMMMFIPPYPVKSLKPKISMTTKRSTAMKKYCCRFRLNYRKKSPLNCRIMQQSLSKRLTVAV
jgi:D-alanine-D-alanine ligase